MIIDVHNHVGTDVMGTKGCPEDLLSIMQISHIDKSVIFALDEVDRGETYEVPNKKIIQLCRKYPEKFIGVCRVQPKAGDNALKEMERCQKAGLSALKLHPRTEQFGPDSTREVLDLAQNFNWPILLHTDHNVAATPSEWKPIFKKYPKLSFVLLHGGKDHWPAAAEVSKACDNVFVETSTLSYNRTRMLIERAGAEKIIFGSDYPYSHPSLEVQKFELIVKDYKQLEQIFFKNAQELFGL